MQGAISLSLALVFFEAKGKLNKSTGIGSVSFIFAAKMGKRRAKSHYQRGVAWTPPAVFSCLVDEMQEERVVTVVICRRFHACPG